MSSFSITAPVGFDGEFNMIAFVFSVIFSSTSFACSLNSFSILHSTGTTFPSANFTQASYDKKLGLGSNTSSPFSINA